MKRKGIRLIALALMVLLVSMTLLAGCGSKENTADQGGGDTAKDLPTVGITTGSSGTVWRNIMIDSLEMVGDEYKDAGKIADYKIVNNVNNGDATEQANIIRDFISEGVDIILVNPNSPDALNGVIKEAQDAGILVLSFDATVTAPDVVNVTLDHYAWETKNAEFICETLGGKGNVVDIHGIDGHPADNERIRATDDVLKKYPDIKLIARTSGGWDETKGKEVATQMIGSGQKIDGVFTQDGMGYGVFSAFKDADKLPTVMFGDPGTAFFKEWKALRDAGANFKACTQPNPPGIGGTGFRIALNLYDGKEFKDDILKGTTYYYVVSSFYTDENFDEAWEMLKDKPDDYLLNEVMTQDQVDELFK
ncbi:MAG TPA: substrate-binding domain-containing protein [Bacillota bacterium]|nr:substrate-binding domain-containing protein [Bacillota bacterium]